MKFDRLINELLEDFNPTAQDFNTGLNINRLKEYKKPESS